MSMKLTFPLKYCFLGRESAMIVEYLFITEDIMKRTNGLDN